jgi:formylglycine-generating enzyme required for sulfatase activity
MSSRRTVRRVVAAVALTGATAAVVACQALAGISDLVIGDCKGGPCPAEASTDELPPDLDATISPPVDSGVPCVGKGAASIRVGAVDNDTFCIDTTEVSVADYNAFLSANVDPATQPAQCAWNVKFEPKVPPPVGDAAPLVLNPDDPVAYVDYCDALAYCTWAGKYLCGRFENSKKTGPVTAQDTADYQTHQWLLACTAGARLRYPYGGTVSPSKCNLLEYDAGKVEPVGSVPGCVGGFTGLHDMLGNVWEWYDGPCNAGSLEVDGGDGGPHSDGCGLKGGSFGDPSAGIDCRTDISVRRDYVGSNVGFRCCSD